jgi:glycosyltransferase involved in cell wall biosynthesis
LNYFWAMDDVNVRFTQDLSDPLIAQKVLQNCDAVILCSNHHQQRWAETFKIPAGKMFLSSMGIPLERFGASRFNTENRPRRAYYSSTPHRGLSVLLQAWPMIRAAVPDAELVVYSSLQVYGVPEQPEFLALYDLARKLPGVLYKGSVGQAQLREGAIASRVLAYPCIFPEMGCVAAMEAMAAGCVVVGTSLGALPETAWRNPLVYPNADYWGDEWVSEVTRVLVDDAYYMVLAEQNLALSNRLSWDDVAKRWLFRMSADLAKRGQSIFA